MGVKYAEGVILNVEDMWKESNIRVPMICFLSMGSDPTNTIDMLSRKLNLSKIVCYELVNLTFYLLLQPLGLFLWDRGRRCMHVGLSTSASNR